MDANTWRADRRVGPRFRRGCAVMEKYSLSRRRGDHGENSGRLCRHGCIRCANGAEPKQKLRKRACQIFAFFCQSQLAGIIRDHPSLPWLVLFQPRHARGALKTSSFAWIRGPVSFTAETAVPPSFSPRLGGSAGEFGDDVGGAAPGGGFGMESLFTGI